MILDLRLARVRLAVGRGVELVKFPTGKMLASLAALCAKVLSLNGPGALGSPSSAFAEAAAQRAGIGQPRADCLDTFGVAILPRCARNKPLN